MFNLSNIFGVFKKSDEKNNPSASESNLVKVTKNWYEEKADKAIVQRNILFLLSLLLMLLIIAAIIAVTVIVNLREFSPFVIQIDDSTGAATVVDPASSNILEGNESLTRYFIKKYLIARETYNPVDFSTEARKTIRLFSTGPVYWNYLGYINNPHNDPVAKYGSNNTTFLIIRSWTKMDEKNKYLIRFSINETSGAKAVYDKIAIITYEYVAMELTGSDLDVNPVGFQINGYSVSDDKS